MDNEFWSRPLIAPVDSAKIIAQMEEAWADIALHGNGASAWVVITQEFYDAAMRENPAVFEGILVEIMAPIRGALTDEDVAYRPFDGSERIPRRQWEE